MTMNCVVKITMETTEKKCLMIMGYIINIMLGTSIPIKISVSNYRVKFGCKKSL